MNSVERDGRCRPGLPLPLLFAPVILVTALLVVWPGWLRTAQAQSWVSEEGGGVRHIVVFVSSAIDLNNRVAEVTVLWNIVLIASGHGGSNSQREPLRREGKIVNADCCILGMNRFVPRESGREGGR